jgi:hypothetical protein
MYVFENPSTIQIAQIKRVLTGKAVPTLAKKEEKEYAKAPLLFALRLLVCLFVLLVGYGGCWQAFALDVTADASAKESTTIDLVALSTVEYSSCKCLLCVVCPSPTKQPTNQTTMRRGGRNPRDSRAGDGNGRDQAGDRYMVRLGNIRAGPGGAAAAAAAQDSRFRHSHMKRRDYTQTHQ